MTDLRQLDNQDPPQTAQRSATSPVPSLSARSSATRSRPTCSSGSSRSSDSYGPTTFGSRASYRTDVYRSVKSPKQSVKKTAPADGKAKPSWLSKKPPRPSSSTSFTMRICAPSTPSALPFSKKTYSSLAVCAQRGERLFERGGRTLLTDTHYSLLLEEELAETDGYITLCLHS
jgi:hypothetical protein